MTKTINILDKPGLAAFRFMIRASSTFQDFFSFF